MATEKYTCPCCGYKTLDKEPPGTYLICEICFWEDDYGQFHYPDEEGGANVYSLRQGQDNFQNGINVNRHPTEHDVRDPNWKPLSS
ncbi:CPCC family cysteine-rich protein [Brevibacillus brevis]|uniref:CPCC family cysteine-rich protein n=1 Tax=Brevibacillus brevis TaxID=1393 RepID=UPI001C8D6C2B|nr:CPCC family cysteine-rich protein [Brevibacillus brevis]MBY0088436.1 hypothetical protein [Brevibacillus brevis]